MEMQIKTTLRYHLPLIKTASIKKSHKIVGEDVEKEEPYLLIEGMQISTPIMVNSSEVPQKS